MIEKSDTKCTRWALTRYFLWLGTFGFGGPIALIGHMQRDLVLKKQWITEEEYLEGLALAKLCPGPLASQLAIYLGWLRFKVLGATLVAVAFTLPAFLIVLSLAIFYVHYGSLPWIQSILYGIGAAVIAIIIRSAYFLIRMTAGKDIFLWTLVIISSLFTIYNSSDLVWLFMVCGVLTLLLRAPPGFLKKSSTHHALFLITGIHGVASSSTLLKIVLYFTWAGAFIFGSGLVIIPFLHGGVVAQYHWLTERQFMDAIAVGMITPGPMIITVAFIGYLVAGTVGALLAAVSISLPCYLLVIILAPYYHRMTQHPSIKAFVTGVTASATGAIGGAAFILGQHSLTSLNSILIFLGTLLLIFTTSKIPEPLIILAAGIIGILLQQHFFPLL